MDETDEKQLEDLKLAVAKEINSTPLDKDKLIGCLNNLIYKYESLLKGAHIWTIR